jgi:O-methyltransferase involved in polyketide biosynthesis
MKKKRESLTALRVALYKAFHQIFDDVIIFMDPLAIRILLPDEQACFKHDPRFVVKQYQAIVSRDRS